MAHHVPGLTGFVLPLLALLQVGAVIAAPPPSDLQQLSERVQDSVVEILGTVEGTGESSYGSGFVLNQRNLVVTNAHVVRGIKRPMVRTREGALLASVEVIDTDEHADLAVLRVTGLSLPPLALGSLEMPPVGTEVVAVGHPRGYEFTVSNGIVSAHRRLEKDSLELLQITAPISPGSSGGPLVDRSGGVLGVCSLTLTEGQNINFAVPAEDLVRFVENSLALERSLAQKSPEKMPAEAVARLVRRHRDDGDLVRAGELLRRGLSVHPESVPLLREAAELAWSRGSYEEVEAVLSKIQVVAPDDAPAEQIRGALAAQRGDCSGAIVASEKALGAGLVGDPAADAHAVLAECLAKAGERERALKHIDEALRSERIAELPDYHALRAFLYQGLGRADDADVAAIEALTRAQWDPLVVGALRERGLPRLIEVVSQRVNTGEGQRIVTGIVRNRGPIPLREVELTAEGTDRSGTVIATGTGIVAPGRLVPGQTGSFTITVSGAIADVERFTLRVVNYRENDAP